MVKDRFSRFEAHIERLVEGSFSRLFLGHLHPREIAVQLARAMEDSTRTGESGQAIAPHRYTVALNPADYEAITGQQPDLAQALAGEVVEMARAAGLQLARAPGVVVVPDERIASHSASVRATHDDEPEDSTQALEVMPLPPADAALKASLVSNEDHRTIPLERDVVNLGRSRDNHIILDDPRVSRHHAQLRLRFGRYVLFDLDSQAGTSVNGQPVVECILQHGDVLSLGGVRLIYTEDGDGSSGGAPPAEQYGLDETEGHPPIIAS